MTRIYSTFLAAAAIAGSTGFTGPTAAIEYPWCAQYTGGENGGGRNCGFTTREQCMNTVRGIGGFCEPNLFYFDRADQPAKNRPRRRD